MSSGYINLPVEGSTNGTVTSVGLSAPAIFTVSGSPVTTSGTLALSLATQTANRVWAGPTTGAAATPTFRALVAADLPSTSVIGPGSSTNSAVALWNGVSGNTLKDSNITYISNVFSASGGTYLNFNSGDVGWNSSLGISLSDRRLYDSGSNNSVMWEVRLLYDAGNNLAIDWTQRNLVYTGVTLVDWKNLKIFDISAGLSIDWSARQLWNQTGNKTIDWDGVAIYDRGGILSIDGHARGLYDASAVLSLAYESRYLASEVGNPVIYWGIAGINIPGLTRNKVLYLDNSNYLASSTASDTQVGYLDSATGRTGSGNLVLGTSPTFVTDITTPKVKNTATQTTITGNAGTAVCSEPEQGSSYKKVIVYLNGYTNNATQNYTYPTAFSHTPVAVFTSAGVVATISTTTVSIVSTAVTGYLILEGF